MVFDMVPSLIYLDDEDMEGNEYESDDDSQSMDSEDFEGEEAEEEEDGEEYDEEEEDEDDEEDYDEEEDERPAVHFDDEEEEEEEDDEEEDDEAPNYNNTNLYAQPPVSHMAQYSPTDEDAHFFESRRLSNQQAPGHSSSHFQSHAQHPQQHANDRHTSGGIIAESQHQSKRKLDPAHSAASPLAMSPHEGGEEGLEFLDMDNSPQQSPVQKRRK